MPAGLAYTNASIVQNGYDGTESDFYRTLVLETDMVDLLCAEPPSTL